MFKKEIESIIEINKSSLDVWKALIDFDSYPKWNPFIISISGTLNVNHKIMIKTQLSSSEIFTFKPTLFVIDPCQELRWKGQFIFPKIFDGEHIFLLEEIAPQKTRFIQKEIFTGLLIPLASSIIRRTSEKFENMNKSLKKYIEEN